MDKVSEDINHILAKWDPIRVGENIATDEYKGYIPMILHLLPNRQELMEYLENVLMNEMGLDYNSNNKNHLYESYKKFIIAWLKSIKIIRSKNYNTHTETFHTNFCVTSNRKTYLCDT